VGTTFSTAKAALLSNPRVNENTRDTGGATDTAEKALAHTHNIPKGAIFIQKKLHI
jgi:hypothetical protein